MASANGRGTVIVVQGPAGIGKTTMLRAACAAAAVHGMRTLTARGLPLEQGFSYGIVRQLLEPVRATASPGEWDALLGGAARFVRRVFDGADPGTPEEGPEGDVPHATRHGLYWLAASLAAREPLVLAVDDAQWADAPSLRWLSHLAARIDDLPLLLLVAARTGPDQPELLGELRSYPACVPLELRPLRSEATAELVRDELGAPASPELCAAAHAATGGNPFLLGALVKAVRAHGGAAPDEVTVLSLGPQPVADAVARRIGQLGEGTLALARGLAVLGRPAPLRHAAALADMQLPQAALLTDQLREAGILASGALLEFEYPIVRTAMYDSIPPATRALAHAHAAGLLRADGADAELIGLHLLRGEPAADPAVVTGLRAAAAAATGRGSPDTAAGYLRRALAEPPPAAERAALLLDLGLALASDRDQVAVAVLHEAVRQAPDKATPALLAAGVLGIWGHHNSAAEIALTGLSAPGTDPDVTDRLEAELFANSYGHTATAHSAWDRIRPRLAAAATQPGIADWHVYDALAATFAARPGSEALARLAPVLPGGMSGAHRDSLCGVIAMWVLILNDGAAQARAISDAVLEDARARGSANMIANVCSLRSLIMRRLGRLREAADDGQAGFDFKLRTSPPVSVAWAATFLVEALARLSRFDEAEAVVAETEARRPPPGWIHTVSFIQARGSLRVTQQRYEEGLADLRAAAEGWRALGIASPALGYWRVPAVAAYTAVGQEREAARLAAEQLELARAVGTPSTLGVSLRVAAPFAPDPERTLAEALSLLESTDGRYEHAVALTHLGAIRRRRGRRLDAKLPLRQAMDSAERIGARQLREYARTELIAAGARPRRAALTGPEALTSAERQVANLAAEGRSNRQIAQRLFVSQATIETHLRHAFHKLGITSRADLPSHLTDG
jgi:DNA-binding CsgD family transcriptional regulator